jgi:hypothetical protein
MKMKRKMRFNPVYWGILFFAIAQVLTFCIISRENAFLQANHIYIPPLFAWGIFIALVFWVPVTIAVTISVVVGLTWFFAPRVWLHGPP